MKKVKVVPCPEISLPPSERRKRARRMAAITAGCNPVTKRQTRRLPSRPTKAGANKEKWMLKRVMRKQGMIMGDLNG